MNSRLQPGPALKTIVVGGGIGGLTAALCLHHFGHQPVVLERAVELEEVGAGLQVSPNGMQVFQALGLAEAIGAMAFRPEALEMRMGRSGRRVFSIPVADEAIRRWGAPYLHIHRADLVEALRARLAALVPGALRVGAEVTAYEQGPKRAQVRLSDDTVLDGDVVIGADGIHSIIRTRMLGPDAPEFTGNVAWRAVVPIERLGDLAPPPTACVWVGPARHAVTYRLRGGQLANLVGVVEHSGWSDEAWTAQGTREQALADFAGWHPVVTNLIERADTHFRWALFDRKPLPHWSDGRVALLGDACHPMLPFMAQGAVMAIEDAWVLAACVSAGGDDIAAALQRYFDMRIARTTRIQAAAWGNMATFHQRTRLAQAATYGPMWLAGHLAPGIVHSRQDWIYGHDVTKS